MTPRSVAPTLASPLAFAARLALAAPLALSAPFAVTACTSDTPVLPPLGEVVLVVDTDAPVPKLAGRLRIDVFDDAGGSSSAAAGDFATRWLDSRDVPLENADDWPASFSVYIDDERRGRSVVVRLRAYPESKIRDYRGERPAPAPAGAPGDVVAAPAPPPGEAPRLVRGGVDVTPDSEPEPALAIDRLVALRVGPGRAGHVTVVLHGACVGTQADLAGRASCVDAAGERAPVATSKIAGGRDTPARSTRVGTFGAPIPCTVAPRPPGAGPDQAPLRDEELCIPGGVLVLGSPEVSPGAPEVSIPERAAVVAPFLIDTWEVTVGRFRRALAEGLALPIAQTPVPNEAPLGLDSSVAYELCTWSAAPRGREDHPLNCVPWEGARAFCRFYGGDLPSEAQWELAAAADGRVAETRYPWGTVDPTCDRMVFGRFDDELAASTECLDRGLPFGPASVDANLPGDVTVRGVVGLGGGVAEWVRDALHPYDAVCWKSAPLFDPECVDDAAPERARRGVGWSGYGATMLAAHRDGAEPTILAPDMGFRCVRAGLSP